MVRSRDPCRGHVLLRPSVGTRQVGHGQTRSEKHWENKLFFTARIPLHFRARRSRAATRRPAQKSSPRARSVPLSSGAGPRSEGSYTKPLKPCGNQAVSTLSGPRPTSGTQGSRKVGHGSERESCPRPRPTFGIRRPREVGHGPEQETCPPPRPTSGGPPRGQEPWCGKAVSYFFRARRLPAPAPTPPCSPRCR